MKTELYRSQLERWPRTGRHILAQFDEQGVVVYQAYRPSLGLFAARNQYFGGEYKLSRMSWIKPNFLWMMYRCGWGTKPDQEITLAVTIRREAFGHILAQAVHSSCPGNTIYGTHAEWQDRVKNSNVRLQWDPDHARTETSNNGAPFNWASQATFSSLTAGTGSSTFRTSPALSRKAEIWSNKTAWTSSCSLRNTSIP